MMADEEFSEVPKILAEKPSFDENFAAFAVISDDKSANLSEKQAQGILIPESGLQPAAVIGSAGVQCRSGEIGQTRSFEKRVAPQPSGFKTLKRRVTIPAPAHNPANISGDIQESSSERKETGFRNWSDEPEVTPQPSATIKDALLFKPFVSLDCNVNVTFNNSVFFGCQK